MLTWQHWRQSAPLAWVFFVVVLLMFLLDLMLLLRVGNNRTLVLYHGFHDVIVAFVLFAIPLLGSFTFLGDQRRTYFRFFAQRGIGPRLVWLSRLWPWLVIVPCFYARGDRCRTSYVSFPAYGAVLMTSGLGKIYLSCRDYSWATWR